MGSGLHNPAACRVSCRCGDLRRGPVGHAAFFPGGGVLAVPAGANTGGGAGPAPCAARCVCGGVWLRAACGGTVHFGPVGGLLAAVFAAACGWPGWLCAASAALASGAAASGILARPLARDAVGRAVPGVCAGVQRCQPAPAAGRGGGAGPRLFVEHWQCGGAGPPFSGRGYAVFRRAAGVPLSDRTAVCGAGPGQRRAAV